MTHGRWKNPWMLTATAMVLVGATGFGTGLVLTNWSGGKSDKNTPLAMWTKAAGVPPQGAIDTCNKSAASQAGQREKTKETVVPGTIGEGGGGTLYGLNATKKHDERYRTAYAACMQSRGHMS